MAPQLRRLDPGAIYGANDGLAAVFGIVAGVSGATGGTHVVLTAGLFGAIASALSMATGAYLAERSTNEVAAANLAREREEVARHPEEEKEELSLFYQLKGLTAGEARTVVERIAEDPEQLFRAIATEELGGADAQRGNAVQAALAGGISTAFGAIIPVIPFFWLRGNSRHHRRRRRVARRPLRASARQNRCSRCAAPGRPGSR